MPMPKGFKSKNGYATVTEFESGADYRTIAETMTKSGHKMNHATARNVFLGALRKIAKPVHKMHGLSENQDDLQVTAKDPRFQSGVAEILETLNRNVRLR
jgi:hypothetical protein